MNENNNPMIVNKTVNHNIKNEFIILASMMHSSAVRKKVSKVVETKHFFSKSSKIIFEGLKYIADNNLEYDADTLSILLRDKDDYGGIDKIISIEEAFDENVNIDEHINILKKDYFRIYTVNVSLNELSDLINDPMTKYEVISSKIRDIQEDHKNILDKNIIIKPNSYDERTSYYDLINAQRRGDVFGSTGFKELDENLAVGFAPKKVSITAGRTGTAKSILSSNFALKKILNGEKILFLPLEVGIDSFKHSLISNHANILYDHLMPRGIKNISENEFNEMKKKIHNAYNDIFGFTPEYEAKLKKMSMEDSIEFCKDYDSKCFIIDKPITNDELFNILSSNNFTFCCIDLYGKLKGYEPDQKIITQRLDEIQQIAKEVNSHINLVSQINREFEKNYYSSNGNGKRPIMSQLKQSGSLEEVADLILLLYRHKYYHPNEKEDVLEINIAKQRQGGIMGKTVGFDFIGAFHRIGQHRKEWDAQSKTQGDKIIKSCPINNPINKDFDKR